MLPYLSNLTVRSALDIIEGGTYLKKTKILILTLGVFSIINTEMGVVGILPMIAEHFSISISTAGLLVSLFALAVAIAGPTMPLLFSRVNRKTTMLLVLSVFTLGNIVSAFSPNFAISLIARVVPAFFHPVYVSLAFSVASSSVSKEEAPQAVSRVMMGVSAGMVLGVPVVSYIAGITSLTIAMLFFAAVNAIVLIATIFLFPSMPVKEKMAYGEQLQILKDRNVWISIIGVMLLNGAIFGAYSYLSEYLSQTTGYSANIISIALFVYGMANIIGNAIAGKKLSTEPKKFVLMIPMIIVFVYVVQTIFGSHMVLTAAMIILWGILAGCVANINQYWLSTAAPHAPDFANGLFLASTNLGTTVGTTICGGMITSLGTSSIFLGGIVMLLGSIAFLFMRIKNEKKRPKHHQMKVMHDEESMVNI